MKLCNPHEVKADARRFLVTVQEGGHAATPHNPRPQPKTWLTRGVNLGNERGKLGKLGKQRYEIHRGGGIKWKGGVMKVIGGTYEIHRGSLWNS